MMTGFAALSSSLACRMSGNQYDCIYKKTQLSFTLNNMVLIGKSTTELIHNRNYNQPLIFLQSYGIKYAVVQNQMMDISWYTMSDFIKQNTMYNVIISFVTF